MKEKREVLRLCKICGSDLPPGGTRRVGVCVWCVANAKQNKVTIPRQSYGRYESDTNS
jgi:hypothetical protein